MCGVPALQEIGEFRLLPRVTSDCVPFRAGGRLLVCGVCGAAQSPADRQWFDEIDEIYRAYRSFQTYGGPEQQVLDANTGELRPRSQVLLDCLCALPGFPRKGTVLDVGCGGGATLRAFSERGDWRLFGHEIDGRDLPLLRAIPGFEQLFTGPLTEIGATFDAVALVHSLEHFVDPLSALQDLRTKVAPGGRLIAQVPDAGDNAFEYLVADHMVHFTAQSLSRLVARAGFSVECLSAKWVRKELSLTSRPSNGGPGKPGLSKAGDPIGDVRAQVRWLGRFLDAAAQASHGVERFGLFGSTVAATWLCAMLGDAVGFFVEEDANRVGRIHMNRPILSPEQVPPGSLVYVALIPGLARRVAVRLANCGIHFQLPPE